MARYKVWIDCDPGVDDAAALMLAAKMPEIEVVGISATAGNVELNYTYRNARNLAAYVGLDVPVYKGANAPLIRKPVYAKEVHGKTGLGGEALPMSAAPDMTKPAWDALYEAAVKSQSELVLIFIGPLTNLALALRKYPDLPQYVSRLILMGGSSSFGNTTSAAEFNIVFDPEAAAVVFESDLTISMLGLDVTMQASLKQDDLEMLARIGGETGRFLKDSLQVSLNWLKTLGLDAVAMHDPCTLLYLVYPAMFKSEMAGVKVETRGELTYGKTVTDLYSDTRFPVQNVDVVLEIDHAEFMKVFAEILGKYKESSHGA